MKISDYKIVGAGEDEDVEDAVRKLLEEGWVPLGGVSVAIYCEDSFWYSQTMVKYAENERLEGGNSVQRE